MADASDAAQVSARAAALPPGVPGDDLEALHGWDGISLDAWPQLKADAAAQLGESPESRAAALPALRAKLQALPESERPSDLSDACLLRYLRGRKFRIDDAAAQLVAAAKFEREHPDWFSDLRGEEFRELYKSGFQRLLRGRDRVGRRLSLLLPSRFPEDVDSRLMMRWSFWSQRRLARCPYLQVYGSAVYENFETFSFKQSMKMNTAMPPSAMRASFYYLQKCSATRMGGILVANQPTFMTVMWALVRPFMSAKLRARVRLLGPDLAPFSAETEPALLPAEFGGTLSEDPMAWFDEQIALEAAGR